MLRRRAMSTMVREEGRDHEHLTDKRGEHRSTEERRLLVTGVKEQSPEPSRKGDGEERPGETLKRHEPRTAAKHGRSPETPRIRRILVKVMARDSVRQGHRGN